VHVHISTDLRCVGFDDAKASVLGYEAGLLAAAMTEADRLNSCIKVKANTALQTDAHGKKTSDKKQDVEGMRRG
jgi:hypothetical protein